MPDTSMKAMLLEQVLELHEESVPLRMADIPIPKPGNNEILIRVSACGVCHTELDEIEGRTPPPVFPIIPGHQVVGEIVEVGQAVIKHNVGDRVGVAWIHSACGICNHCKSANENLCDQFRATGRDANGGYAEYMTVTEDFAHRIPEIYKDSDAAPLLCAGAVGYRALRLTGIDNGDPLGLMGFGASAHLVLKLVRFIYPQSEVFVFARKEEERKFALTLGATWAGDIHEQSPEKLKAIIDTTPVWKPVVEALNNLDKGGRLVVNAIRKEETDKEYLLNLSYEAHLWQEKELKTVANVTSGDVAEFLELSAKANIKPHVQEYPLEAANKALIDLKFRKIKGAKVLVIGEPR